MRFAKSKARFAKNRTYDSSLRGRIADSHKAKIKN